MKLLHDHPARRRLQVVEVVLLAALLPLALVRGAHSWRLYANMVACERTFAEADWRIDNHDYRGAVACCRRCIVLNPRFFPAYDAIATLQASEFNDLAGAIRTLEDGLPYIGGDVRTHQDLGYYYLLAREYRKAQDHLRIVAAVDPTNLTCRGLLRRANRGVAKQTL